MPVYEYVCAEGHTFERYLKLADYQQPQLCILCGGVGTKLISAPFVNGDYPEYASPRTGEIIRGRAQRREDLLRHDCVEWEPGFKEECIRRKAADDRREEADLDSLIDSEIQALPIRKREALAGEMESGLDVNLVRKGL